MSVYIKYHFSFCLIILEAIKFWFQNGKCWFILQFSFRHFNLCVCVCVWFYLFSLSTFYTLHSIYSHYFFCQFSFHLLILISLSLSLPFSLSLSLSLSLSSWPHLYSTHIFFSHSFPPFTLGLVSLVSVTSQSFGVI